MSTYSTENTEREGNDAETEDQSRAGRLAGTLKRHTRSGTLPILAGGALIVRALRSSGRGGRIVQGAIGAGLIVLGVRRRRSGGGVEIPLDEVIASDDEEEVSAEAKAHADQQRVLQQDEQNPRGTSGEPDVETETDPDGGNVHFHDDQDLDPETRPHMDEDGPHDTRMDDQIGDDEGGVDVDLSEAAMADEASEATGPSPEQAQPASTEGTEPEQTPPEDASHMQADEPGGEDTDDESEGADDAETAEDANMTDGGEFGDDEEPTDENDGDDEAPTANGDGEDDEEPLTDD